MNWFTEKPWWDGLPRWKIAYYKFRFWISDKIDWILSRGWYIKKIEFPEIKRHPSSLLIDDVVCSNQMMYTDTKGTLFEYQYNGEKK